MMNCPGNYPINYPINRGQSPLRNYLGGCKVRTQHVTQYSRGRPRPELEEEEDLCWTIVVVPEVTPT